jgi:hypothetical protein
MSKLEKHDWQIQNEDEIIDRWLEDEEYKIKGAIKHSLKANILSSRIAVILFEAYAFYVDAQYEEYLDTEEFNDTDVGCSFSEGER